MPLKNNDFHAWIYLQKRKFIRYREVRQKNL